WPAAIGFWQRLIESSPPDADYVAQVREGIEEARRRMTVAGAASGAVSGAVAAPSATAPAAAAAVAGPVLRGTVALSERLRAQVRPEDVVFVFARPAEGPRMPLAVVKAQVKDLPLNFALDDSMAMSPAARLSGSPRVVVTARISRTGQAGPQAGDLTGESGVVAADAQGVRIEIADVVARP
ncbi:MAG: c-type cytochrome biogenesis protein CcmI/CycH, partial [Rubrivivax sp.]